jgi:hypothetical protein
MNERVSTSELAKLCRRTPRTIRRWVRLGKVRPVSQLTPDLFGPETLAALGLLAPPAAESGGQRKKRAAKALFGR